MFKQWVFVLIALLFVMPVSAQNENIDPLSFTSPAYGFTFRFPDHWNDVMYNEWDDVPGAYGYFFTGTTSETEGLMIYVLEAQNSPDAVITTLVELYESRIELLSNIMPTTIAGHPAVTFEYVHHYPDYPSGFTRGFALNHNGYGLIFAAQFSEQRITQRDAFYERLVNSVELGEILPDTVEGQTFTSAKYAFSVTYPDQWTPLEYVGDSQYFLAIDDPFKNSPQWFFIYVMGRGMELEEMVEEFTWLDDIQLVGDVIPMTVDGVEALQFDFDEQYNFEQSVGRALAVNHNGYSLMFVAQFPPSEKGEMEAFYQNVVDNLVLHETDTP